MDRLQELVFRGRNVLVALPLAYLLFTTRWKWEGQWALWPLALFLCLAGVLLRNWANRHCRYRLREQNRLSETGPYACTRNPLYLGSLLILLGLSVASGVLWFLPLMLVWAMLVFNVVARREEKRMARKYGQAYRDYCLRTPRWIPLLIPRAQIPAMLRDAAPLLALLPFLLKELDLFSWWN